jgi:hypothetical protein
VSRPKPVAPRVLNPCAWCEGEKRGAALAKCYTVFVRHHPFKPGWEVRRCVECLRTSGQSSTSQARRLLPHPGAQP